MKVLITGAGGFIGKNLVATLAATHEYEVLPFHFSMGEKVLREYSAASDFVIHLAGVNRPENTLEYQSGNADFTQKLICMLEAEDNRPRIIFSSSTQAKLDNPYGRSKLLAEDVLFSYEKRTGSEVFIYRLPNVFGKWSRPDYNSAVATFCHHAARGLPLTVSDPKRQLRLVYIDDVVGEFLRALEGTPTRDGRYCRVPVVYEKKLGDISEWIKKFPDCRKNLSVPDEADEFIRKLYATYLSFLPENDFSYPLTMHTDSRGSFTEFIRTKGQGQFSVNISRPHIKKGDHWHHTKHEKFLVVSGEGLIRLRPIEGDRITEHKVSGKKLEVVEIPPGYTHSIENIGETDMVTLMWANENFDPDKPDTIPLEV